MAIETVGGIFAIFAAFLIIFVGIFIIVYVYFSLTLMLTAKRLKTKNAWLAWIPLINIILFPKMAKKPSWPLVFIFIPILFNLLTPSTSNIANNTAILILFAAIAITGLVFSIHWILKILERRGKPGWWVILLFVPLFNIVWAFIMWGILAWGEEGPKERRPPQNRTSYDPELVNYLKKYSSQGHSIEQLRQHLIKEGESPREVDEAIKHLQ